MLPSEMTLKFSSCYFNVYITNFKQHTVYYHIHIIFLQSEINWQTLYKIIIMLNKITAHASTTQNKLQIESFIAHYISKHIATCKIMEKCEKMILWEFGI